MKNPKKIKFIAAFLVFVSFSAYVSAEDTPVEIKRLQNTSKALRSLAQTKRNMAGKSKDEAAKAKLLDGAAQDEKLADESDGKAEEESALWKNSAYKAAKLAEDKAAADLKKSDDELDAIKSAIQKSAENSKERETNAEAFLKKVKEAGAKEAALEKAKQKREAVEAKARQHFGKESGARTN